MVLIRSAHSSNIKERRDASTALFDADGQMIMQAEHIPVHLGAMPAAVAAVIGERACARASRGSSTTRSRAARICPDITRRHPGLHRRGELIGFAAAAPTTRTSAARRRARCPPTAARSTRRASSSHRARSMRPRWRSSSPLMRRPQERRADLRAQLAANRAGALRLSELAGGLGRGPAAAGDRRRPRLLRAADARLPRRAAGRRARRTRRARGARGRPRAAPAREGRRRDRLMLDFSGSAAAVRRAT